MNVVEMLTLLTDVVDSVHRAVRALEAGERADGMSELDRCIGRLECTLEHREEPHAGASEVGLALDPHAMWAELDAVLDDLRAARDILLARTAEHRDS